MKNSYMPHATPTVTEHIAVDGIVQGVGFRPFIHGLATRLGLDGHVANTPDGVVIEVTGGRETVDAFARAIETDAPPLARIVTITRDPVDGGPRRGSGFVIRESSREGAVGTLISPDVAVCGDCLDELFDPADRRYLYPFINCTNCGPRFTIIEGLPYDRPYTTMASFTMCPDCATEYGDPADRRFHAQPDACPVCGPSVTLVDCTGTTIDGNPVTTSIDLLRQGKVLAVKGLGGFHLAVDAMNEQAVALLRARKHREEKPLAVMAPSLDHVRRLVRLDRPAERLVASRERPILLAPRKPNAPLAANVAPDNDYLGVMLPYTPLHYLLFFHPDRDGDIRSGTALFDALVMTSANLSEEPICRDNDEALDRLGDIADAFLVHNRDIHVRGDDSVVTTAGDELSFIRRSRGYVPVPVFLKKPVEPVLAFGAELKNTICIASGRRAFVSQHIGDLENITTMDFFHEAVTHFRRILEIEPRIFAYDPHPGYLSSRYARELFGALPTGSYGAAGVQHHHAHIAAVMAEHGISEPVLGFSLDGTGYGPDGTVWGGEFLVATPASFVRLGHLAAVPLPGGEKAVREPWRMAFAHLRAAFGDDWRTLDLPCLAMTAPDALTMLDAACRAGVNAPLTSSMGRLFDGVASILGIRHINAYEGQAAIMLDMLAGQASAGGDVLPYLILDDDPSPLPLSPELAGTLAGHDQPLGGFHGGHFILDMAPAVRELVHRLRHGNQAILARSFHDTILDALLAIARRLRESTGIVTVALSGGVWQNRYLSERFPAKLRAEGFTVLTHCLVPPNDGGLSLGQAYVAASLAAPAPADSRSTHHS